MNKREVKVEGFGASDEEGKKTNDHTDIFFSLPQSQTTPTCPCITG